MQDEQYGRMATPAEADREWATNAGSDRPDQAWILSDRDVWYQNPAYQGPPVSHPEDYEDEKLDNYHGKLGSQDCVRQHEAFKQAGIVPQARSVKQVKACAGCTYFNKGASGKTCNLYHLPVVANTQELAQIVNNLTPGVPEKRKHAALVAIANGEDKRVQPIVASAQTNIVKTADARVKNQQKRTASMFADSRETTQHFSAEHVGKMHDKGASLEQIYKWASEKFGDVDTSL